MGNLIELKRFLKSICINVFLLFQRKSNIAQLRIIYQLRSENVYTFYGFKKCCSLLRRSFPLILVLRIGFVNEQAQRAYQSSFINNCITRQTLRFNDLSTDHETLPHLNSKKFLNFAGGTSIKLFFHEFKYKPADLCDWHSGGMPSHHRFRMNFAV